MTKLRYTYGNLTTMLIYFVSFIYKQILRQSWDKS